MDLPVMPPLKPMLAKALDELPEGDLALEPKWDGFRCIVCLLYTSPSPRD